MNKKQAVKILLDILQEVPESSRPTTSEGNLDMPMFYEMPEVKAVITLLKAIKVDSNYLHSKGFLVAGMLLGSKLK